jgi:hypothetical protein
MCKCCKQCRVLREVDIAIGAQMILSRDRCNPGPILVKNGSLALLNMHELSGVQSITSAS